jgi:hypothetical protein
MPRHCIIGVRSFIVVLSSLISYKLTECYEINLHIKSDASPENSFPPNANATYPMLPMRSTVQNTPKSCARLSVKFSITPQHTLYQITQWTPEIFASVCQTMLVDEENVMLEARVEMRLKP